MPTYEYVCTKCGEGLEAVQSFNDPPLTKCPACKGKLRKVFSAAGVIFKGSGFYKTDSRSGGKSASTAPAKEAASTSGSTDSGTGSSSTPASSDSGSTKKSGDSTSTSSAKKDGGSSKVA